MDMLATAMSMDYLISKCLKLLPQAQGIKGIM